MLFERFVKKIITVSMILFLSLIFFVNSCKQTKNDKEVNLEQRGNHDKTFKIAHVMSYHSPWKWTDDQLAGFKDGLKDLNSEFMIFQMDTKNTNTNDVKKKAVSEKIISEIDNWKPDMIYTTDDDVQEYIAPHYINSKIPYVFSAVNSSPESYGFVGSKNIAGVLEEMHFIPSVRLLQQINPAIKKIAVISNPGNFWDSVIAKMKEQDASEPGIEILTIDFVEKYSNFKKKILDYNKIADAICFLGIFNYVDAQGNNVSFDDVLKWTAENCPLPDFSYWRDRVEKGTFCSMTISGYEQGLAAGKLAYAILAEGKSPDSFQFLPTVKGEPMINLARAKKLGIQIQSDVLLTVEAVETFGWKK